MSGKVPNGGLPNGEGEHGTMDDLEVFRDGQTIHELFDGKIGLTYK